MAIEPHRDSYLQACENVSACPWSSRIKVENISFNEFYNRSDMQFDFIIANPPYFINSLLNPDKSKASARHAFSLTPDDLFSGSSFLLKESGSLQVILPYPEGTLFISAAAERGLYCNNIIRIKAVPSGPVIRLILKFEKKKRQTRESFLTIETGSIPKYTDEYIRATRDFYLNF